jgi:hypothetical protein
MPAYAFMESVLPELPVARRFTATSIACPACGVPSGTACSGPRVCAERLDVALDLMRAGQLAEAAQEEPSAPMDLLDSAGCQDCGQTRSQAGRPIACPDHRCQRVLRTGRRCRSPFAPGARYCPPHGLEHARRWN